MSLDLLDYPLYPKPGQEELTPNELQFNLYLLEIDIMTPAVAVAEQETPVVNDTVLQDIAGIDINLTEDAPFIPPHSLAA